MMHNRGTAPTGGTFRPLRTPLPPALRPEEEAALTFKPSQKPWARLLWNPEPNSPTPFAQIGRSVQIYGAKQIEVSPTQYYTGQTNQWLRTDHDTLYRFQKRIKVRRIHVIETPVSVPHVKLLPCRPSTEIPLRAIRCPRERYPMNKEAVVYTKEAMTINFGQVPLEVKMHTGVTLAKAASRHQRPGDRTSNVNPENMHYITRVYVETQEWLWVPCAKAVAIGSLQQLTKQEIDALNGKTLAKPKVMSAETLPFNMREQNATQGEDKHE